LAKLAEAKTLRLSIKMLACTQGNEGVCFPKACVWELPITVAEDSTQRSLTLESKPLQRP
jgi:hypothetical protein